jgi:hypothetical protein
MEFVYDSKNGLFLSISYTCSQNDLTKHLHHALCAIVTRFPRALNGIIQTLNERIVQVSPTAPWRPYVDPFEYGVVFKAV